MPLPTLSPSRALEFWVWACCAEDERSWYRKVETERGWEAFTKQPHRGPGCMRIYAPPKELALLELEVAARRRVRRAFEHAFTDGSSYREGISDPLPARIGRGLDAVGAAYFSRYLTEQLAWWASSEAPVGDATTAKLEALRAAQALFHRLLEADPMEIQRAEAQLRLDDPTRAAKWLVFKGGAVLRGPVIEFPLDPADERWQQVVIRWMRETREASAPTPIAVSSTDVPSFRDRALRFIAWFLFMDLPERDPVAAGSQRYPGDTTAEDAVFDEVLIRFLRIYPRPPPTQQFDRCHMRLSTEPEPGAFEAFAGWLRAKGDAAERSRTFPHRPDWGFAQALKTFDAIFPSAPEPAAELP